MEEGTQHEDGQIEHESSDGNEDGPLHRSLFYCHLLRLSALLALTNPVPALPRPLRTVESGRPGISATRAPTHRAQGASIWALSLDCSRATKPTCHLAFAGAGPWSLDALIADAGTRRDLAVTSPEPVRE